MSNVKQISKNTFASQMNDGQVLFLSNRMDDSLESLRPFLWDKDDWEATPHVVGPFKVVPYGPDGRLPIRIRNIVADNNLVPGIINRQLGLLWGQGPFLYSQQFINNEISRVWTPDPEIEAWLKSWNYEAYLRACVIDYLHIGGFFDAKYLTRGGRIGKQKKIAYLEHIPAKNALLEWPESRDPRDVKSIIVGDVEHDFQTTGATRYPVYEPSDPGKHRVSAAYNHLYSFCRDFYSMPAFWGALRWIIKGSEIPTIFKYVTDNSINLAYHVHSPNEYWNLRRDQLRTLHEDWTDAQIEDEIKTLTVQFLQQMTDILSGKENAGKMLHTIDLTDDNGHTVSWKIEPIDQKIKDFVETQLKISEASVSAITSGMSLHPSLSNIMVNGKLASGSELLYAFKLYLSSDVEIASSIILEPINQAIAFNFPGKNLKLGFYHRSVKSEEATSPGDRVKNE